MLRSRCIVWLAGLVVVASPIAGAADGKKVSEAVRAALRPYIESHSVAGVVTLVADRDGVIAADALGYADVADKTPMKADAVFWIASQSKPITSAALMILVDEKKVALDDPISKYLPEFREMWVLAEKDSDHQLLKRPARAVTVRDILRHTSGMPFRSEMEVPTLDGLPLRDAVRSYALTPLQFQPGTKYQYSNAGINTAGRIIEVVSGMPYETFLDERLFKPLGMAETTFWPNEALTARLAKAYKPNAKKDDLVATKIEQLRYPLSDRSRHPMPAGGLFSTADDLSKFCRMLLSKGTLDGKRVLSESAVEQLSTRQTDPGLKESYGLGFSTGGGTFGHGGALATNMTIDPGRGLVTIYLVQHAGFPKDGDRAQAAFRKAAAR